MSRKIKIVDEITLDTRIEENFVCPKKHRAFYKEQIVYSSEQQMLLKLINVSDN